MCNVSLNGTQPTDASLRVLRALEPVLRLGT